MSSKPTSQSTPTKRRGTRAEHEEHSEFARRSIACKKAQGLFRANTWIPKDQNEYFQNLAAKARAQHFARLTPPFSGQTPPSKWLCAHRKPEKDTR